MVIIYIKRTIFTFHFHSLQHSTSLLSATTSTLSKSSTLLSSSTVSPPTPTSSLYTPPSASSATLALSSTVYLLITSTPSNSSFVGISSTTSILMSFHFTTSLDSPSVSSTTSSFSPFYLRLLHTYAILFSLQDSTVIFLKPIVLIALYSLVSLMLTLNAVNFTMRVKCSMKFLIEPLCRGLP